MSLKLSIVLLFTIVLCAQFYDMACQGPGALYFIFIHI